MHLSIILVSALAATAHAAPAFPGLNLDDVPNPVNALDSMSAYFNAIAAKVQAARLLSEAPSCDLSKAQMPTVTTAPEGLLPPAPGLTVRHVAVGRGTQNYTCDVANSTAVPKAAGAVATLFNASCVAALYPDVLDKIPGMAVHFNLTDGDRLGPTVLAKSGVHYFTDATTAFFDLDTPTLDIGQAPCQKNSSGAAPSTASVGQLGDKAVPWLRLTTKEGATNDIKEVFRMTTAGGSAPATCKGMPATFEVQYASVTLRLVCKDFEFKVSASYFRNVVVPFKAEIYSSRDHESAVLSNGMRLFQSFGPHILRFALSLEIDENTLASPPLKLTQRAVPAFWGIYRWPQENYCRYPDIESLEDAADETKDMAEALRCLSKVRNLGLCSDAGLGYLLGPAHKARRAFTTQRVFGTEDWRHNMKLPCPMPERRIVAMNTRGHDTDQDSYSAAAAIKHAVLVRMMVAAGYFGTHQVNEAVRLMLATERISVGDIRLDGIPVPPLETDDDDRPHGHDDAWFFNGEFQNLLSPTQPSETPPLRPLYLTTAQIEMLIELDWAHRAMIESYVMGIIDNVSIGVFNNVTTLSIAKIPSSHIKILCRDDLWQGLPQLKNFSLGVIADWRAVAVRGPGIVQDTQLSPVAATSHVFNLLNSHVGRQANIESLHFEWICGGEFAPSPYQRNQHILPAPFFQQPGLMAAVESPRVNADEILRLPHVMHLSLKNCWVAPHVLLQALRQFALSSLEKLDLESVSLTGPPTTSLQAPLPVEMHQRRRGFPYALLLLTGMADGAHNGVPLPQGVPDHNQDNGLPLHHLYPSMTTRAATRRRRAPRISLNMAGPGIFSWPGIIEYFSPGVKISRQSRRAAGSPAAAAEAATPQAIGLLSYLPADTLNRPKGEQYQLKSMSFKSCGYAALDLAHINTRFVFCETSRILPSLEAIDIGRHMQHCQDILLGIVIPYVRAQDYVNLRKGFGMTLGWEDVYDEQVIQDAADDGVEHPGAGRFSGIIEGGGHLVE
ncbi:F-box domain-containing protein [Purpureocillium lavendulum]|uniref:F-box domain-containing protein n=1 Tax=Purpureocillium lavendulum TaxID=1247861 RepID=A0AB34FYJ4_9HYPO|nr:F-box domain-containing protein [Purpureocillium lavendulum]